MEQFEIYDFFKKPKDLKEEAKEGLRGNRGKSLSINLFLLFSKLCFAASVVLLVLLAINFSNPEFNLILFVILSSVTLLVSILTFGPLKVSLSKHIINMVENTNPRFSDIGYGFKVRYFRNVFYGVSLFFLYIFNLILLIFPFVLRYIDYQSSSFILAEDEEMSISSAFKESKNLTKGSRKRFIKLFFSFFTEYLISIVTGYIYQLWLTPKYMTSVYCFYKDIKK